MIRIVLVDDHRVVVRSLQAYLESFPDLTVVGVAANGEELLARVDEWNPDVILQDLLMPGGLDGVRTTEHLMARRPHSRVVALTASVDEARMMGVLRAGAVAYVRKDADPETLVAAVRAVASGKTFIDPAVSRMLSERSAPDDLTQRELDVLREVALGHTNREIAVILGVTDETVKTHVARVLGKLQVENRAQAIVQALKRGLVTLEEISWARGWMEVRLRRCATSSGQTSPVNGSPDTTARRAVQTKLAPEGERSLIALPPCVAA